MDTRDFVALTLLATGGHVEGKTKLQKLVYFIGVLTDSHDELGYRPHFYGPYSDEVSYAITQLKAIGALNQEVVDWGIDRSGFEIRRYSFTLNASGTSFAKGVAQRNPTTWKQIERAIQAYESRGDQDYMSLSIAAKTYFMLGQKNAPATDHELAALASRFGWSVSSEQVRDAVDDLVELGVVSRDEQ